MVYSQVNSPICGVERGTQVQSGNFYSPYGDVILETNASNVVQAEYVLGGTDLISQTRSSQNDYYLTDALGSVRLMTDGAGVVTNTYDYDAFGELVHQTGSRENSYLYTGQQFDAATGLYSLRARYYDPGAGRFLSYDTWPIDLQNPLELNRYGYGMNNPVRWRDPSGLGLLEYAKKIVNLGIAGIKILTKLSVGDKNASGAWGFLLAVTSGGFWGAVGYGIATTHEAVDWDAADFIDSIILGMSLGGMNYIMVTGIKGYRSDYKTPPDEPLKDFTAALLGYGFVGVLASAATSAVSFLFSISDFSSDDFWGAVDTTILQIFWGTFEYAGGLWAGQNTFWPSGIEIAVTVVGNAITSGLT